MRRTSWASCPRLRGARCRGPAGWMLPRACWRQLLAIDPRARPSCVAPAVARGSIESSSLLGRAARRALGKHSVCLRGDTGSGCVCRGPCVMLPSPSSWASVGSEFEGHRERRESPLPQVLGVRGRGQVWQERGPGLRGFGPHCSLRSSVSPSAKKHTRAGLGPQGARGLLALLLTPLLTAALASFAPCGSGAVRRWAGGSSLGRRGEYREAKLEAQSEGAADTNVHPYFRPSPLLFVLSGDSPPPK